MPILNKIKSEYKIRIFIWFQKNFMLPSPGRRLLNTFARFGIKESMLYLCIFSYSVFRFILELNVKTEVTLMQTKRI